VIENMSYLELPDGSRMDIFGQGGGERLAEASGVPFLGQIPMDPAVREGGDQGTPIVVTHPDSPVAKAFVKLAAELAEANSDDEGSLGEVKIEITD
jgi:ATP-binding protein involved in chromosome partitioning